MNQQWVDLPYETRLQLIRDKTPVAVLRGTYELTDDEIGAVREVVEAVPKLKAGTKLESVSAAPDKRSLREASRDFTMTLTFAELIDNAIDRFIKGKAKAGDTLHVKIVFEREMNACIYEDNAGGIKKEDLPNLFRPGGTDNDPAAWSIGSYAWGAKKARSALSDSVDIISRAVKGPACFATIDRDWDNRDDDWKIKVGEEGKNFELPAKFKVPVGSTRIIYKNLKPLVNTSPAALQDLRRDLGELYALLLEHHPQCPYKFNLKIEIDGEVVTGDYEYRWTQYRDEAVDLHPRQAFYTANVLLPFVKEEAQKLQQIQFILEIGVKQDTGAATTVDESGLFDPTDDWGIDVYGLGVRLIERNLRAPLGLTHELVKKEQGAKLVKARLIILGSSYAIPWDTHKANVAVGHPTLVAINEHIGPLVQEYVRVAQKAARKLKGAVSKFSETPWDGEWVRKEEGAHVAFTYDKTEPVLPTTPPPPADGAAEPNGTPPKGHGKGKKDEEPPAPAAPVAPPVRVSPPKLPAGTKLADYLPKIQTTTSNGSTVKQRSIKFQVTPDEYHRLAIWQKEEGAELNDKIKRYVLKQARAKTKKKKPGKGGAVDTKEFEEIRSKVKVPEVLAKLLTAELTTAKAIKSAGKKGLLDAGLDATKADMVLAAI